MITSIMNEMQYLINEFDHAELHLIENVKASLYAIDNNIYEKLDFYNDSIYLNPLFFYCLNNKKNDLNEILIGSYSENAKFNIYVDSSGIIYIPNFGVFQLQIKNQMIEVNKTKEAFDFKNLVGNILEYTNTPLKKSQYGMKFFEHTHSFLKPMFSNSKVIHISTYQKKFDAALEIINSVFPSFFNLIIRSVKMVVFFTGKDNSFASLQTHGIIYLNVKKGLSVVSFIDDIVHQSAHVIFNTITLKSKSTFFISNHNKSNLDNGPGGDNLYARFHGLYTMCFITYCLTKSYKKKIFNGTQNLELVGRIVDNMIKFERLVNLLIKPEDCTKYGLEWFAVFKTVYNNLKMENNKLISNYDVSNQPYVFDFDIFCKSNPSC